METDTVCITVAEYDELRRIKGNVEKEFKEAKEAALRDVLTDRDLLQQRIGCLSTKVAELERKLAESEVARRQAESALDSERWELERLKQRGFFARVFNLSA